MNPAKPDTDGACPSGYYKQGNFCFPDKKDPEPDGKCPSGFNKQGNVCIQDPKPPDDGKCVEGFVKINNLCYPTKPPGGGDGDGDGDGEEKESGFGGACVSGFTCEGDAIQCAIAKEQHIRNCKFYDTENPHALYKAALDGTDESGVDKLREKAEQRSVGNLDSTGLGWSRSCPADPSFDVAGKSFVIPFHKVCPPLSVLSYAAVALTLLGSLLWVVGTGIKA